METVSFDWQSIVLYILASSGVAAWSSAWLKSKDTNTALQFLKDLLNAVGGNIWNATNKDDDR